MQTGRNLQKSTEDNLKPLVFTFFFFFFHIDIHEPLTKHLRRHPLIDLQESKPIQENFGAPVRVSLSHIQRH